MVIDELFGKKEGGRATLTRLAENFGKLNLKFFNFGFSYMFMSGRDVDGVEELAVDGVAVGFFFVVDGKFGVLEDEELVRVVDQLFGAAVVITRMALAAKASQVGF